MTPSTPLAPDAARSGTFSLGNDLKVHRLGFGAMRITGEGVWGPPKNLDEAKKVLKRAVDLGINFIDTADAYGPETSENLIADALHPYAKDLVVATKGGLTRQGPGSWKPVGRPEYLQQCVEMSLRRLRVDCLDLWQLHRIDSQVPVEDSLGAITELQKAGKVRHIGLSEVSVKELERALKTAKIVSVQNLYNIGDRKFDDVVDYCEKHAIAFIPWFPMGGGDVFKPGHALDKAAKRHGASISQVALAWLLHRSPCILPIPGTSSVAHLEENTAAASLELSADEWKEIEKSAK